MNSIWAIRRSRSDVKLSGLCGGIAEHWGVDPVLVRVGCALLALSGGVGLVLYAAGWLLIPVEGKQNAPVDDAFGNGRRWSKEVWITLVVVACFAVFAQVGSLSPFGIGPAIVLAVIWYFGSYRPRAKQSSPPAPEALTPPAEPFRYPGPATPFTQAAEAWQRRMAEAAGPAAPSPVAREWPTMQASNAGPAPAAYAAHRVAEPVDPAVVERTAFLADPDPVGLYAEPEPLAPVAGRRADLPSARRLRLVGLLVLGLALAGLAIADENGATIPVAAYFGTALGVIGLTLVAATWLGRARGILPVGILVLLGVIITSLNSPYLDPNNWDDASRRYTQVAELPAAGDTQALGELTVDLRDLQVAADTSYTARLQTGSLQVDVPANVNVVVQYDIDAGYIEAYGNEVNSGLDLDGSVTDPTPANPAWPTLTLDLSVDHGEVLVRR